MITSQVPQVAYSYTCSDMCRQYYVDAYECGLSRVGATFADAAWVIAVLRVQIEIENKHLIFSRK